MSDLKQRTRKALKASKEVLTSREYLPIFLGVVFLFQAVFMVAMQDISLNSGSSYGFQVVQDLTIMFEQRAPFQYEPVAQLDIGLVNILISPINIGLGLLLAVLTGLNIVFAYISWRQPDVCKVNKSTGLLSSVPALLAGSACCAPLIPLLLGIQITSALLIFISILIPIAILLLVVNLIVAAGQVDLEKLESR